MEIYKGPIEVGMIFSAPGRDGEPYRRIRILAEHPDGGWIYDDQPSPHYNKMEKTGIIGRCPDFNLRYVFSPEE